MKFNCGLTLEEKQAKQKAHAEETADALREWHDCFAWLPVRVGSGDCRWLEVVERRYPEACAFVWLKWWLALPILVDDWQVGTGDPEYKAKETLK